MKNKAAPPANQLIQIGSGISYPWPGSTPSPFHHLMQVNISSNPGMRHIQIIFRCISIFYIHIVTQRTKSSKAQRPKPALRAANNYKINTDETFIDVAQHCDHLCHFEGKTFGKESTSWINYFTCVCTKCLEAPIKSGGC